MSAPDTMQTKLLARMRRQGAGKVHTSKDFLDLGSRADLFSTAATQRGDATT